MKIEQFPSPQSIDKKIEKDKISEWLLSQNSIEIVDPEKLNKKLEAKIELKFSKEGYPEIRLTNPNKNNEEIGFARFYKSKIDEKEIRPGVLYGELGEKKESLWLDFLRIEDAYRGQGIPSKLLEIIKNESSEQGYNKRVKLQAVSDYGSPSAIIWHKLGFRIQPGGPYHGEKFEKIKEKLEKDVKEGKRYDKGEQPCNLAIMYLPEK